MVGTFIGDLKPEIANEIRMFKPRSVNEAISLSKMRDDQLTQQRWFTRPNSAQASGPPNKTTQPIATTLAKPMS